MVLWSHLFTHMLSMNVTKQDLWFICWTGARDSSRLYSNRTAHVKVTKQKRADSDVLQERVCFSSSMQKLRADECVRVRIQYMGVTRMRIDTHRETHTHWNAHISKRERERPHPWCITPAMGLDERFCAYGATGWQLTGSQFRVHTRRSGRVSKVNSEVWFSPFPSDLHEPKV